MHHLLYDIRKDAVKKASRTSHRHSQEVIEKTIVSVIKAICLTKDNLGSISPDKYFAHMDIQYSVLKEFAVEISFLLEADKNLEPSTDLEYAVEYSTAAYWANEPDGFTALLYFLVIRGVIMIKENYSREKIAKLLVSYIPSGFVKDLNLKELI